MIFRGTDTVAILLEWVMARMVLHPGIQSKTQAELDAVVGRDRAVSDADVARLPYLQRVVKETLRVHPPGPLLSWARLAVHDAVVGGHLVPASTMAWSTCGPSRKTPWCGRTPPRSGPSGSRRT